MSGSRRGVPVVQQTARIEQQPVVRMEGGGAMASLSRSFSDLSRTFAGFGEQQAQRAEDQAAAEARQNAWSAPIRDAEGNYVSPPTDLSTRANRITSDTVIERIVSEEALSGRDRAVRMRQEAGGDPEMFASRWRGDVEGRLQSIPEPARERVSLALRQLGTEHATAQRMDVVQRDQRNTQAGWAAAYDAARRDEEGLVLSGRVDGPEMRAASARVVEQRERGVREGYLSREAADVQRRAEGERLAGIELVRSAYDQIGGGATRENILQQFDAAADQRGWDIERRRAARTLIEEALNDRERIRNEGGAERRSLWDDTLLQLSRGVAIDPAELVSQAEAADRAGQTALARRIRETADIFTEVRSAAASSTPNLIARQTAATQRAIAERQAGTHSARNERYLEILTSMVQQRREAMHRDPLGTAAGVHQSSVDGVRLVPLDFSTPDRLSEGLLTRAQQANRLGTLEGMPRGTMPLLTATEGERFASVIRNGTRDEVVGMLSAVGGLPGDTAVRTLDGLIPGEGREQDRRVGAFMVAAAQARTGNIVLAREILDGAFAMQNLQIGALQGNAFRDHLQQHPAFRAYSASPAALATIMAGAEALYAQRVTTGFDASNPQAGRTDRSGDRGTLSTTVMNRILSQIAPTVTFNRVATAAPPGLSQTQFDDRMSSIPRHVLEGARGENDNRPLTRDILLSHGELVAVGEGRYHVLIGRSRVMRGAEPLVLDLRQPWPEAPPDDFRQRLRQSESGQRIGVVNGEGFVGLYQFGSERLSELNFYRPAPGEGRNGWRGTFNIPGFPQVRTVEDFRRSADAQEFVADTHFQDIDTAIDQLPGAAARDRNGLRAVAHLGGVNGMRQFVTSNGGYDVADSNGTKLSTYYRRFSRAAS